MVGMNDMITIIKRKYGPKHPFGGKNKPQFDEKVTSYEYSELPLSKMIFPDFSKFSRKIFPFSLIFLTRNSAFF